MNGPLGLTRLDSKCVRRWIGAATRFTSLDGAIICLTGLRFKLLNRGMGDVSPTRSSFEELRWWIGVNILTWLSFEGLRRWMGRAISLTGLSIERCVGRPIGLTGLSIERCVGRPIGLTGMNIERCVGRPIGLTWLSFERLRRRRRRRDTACTRLDTRKKLAERIGRVELNTS